MTRLKIDYDKQEHLWNIWEIGPPERIITKSKQVSLRVACELVVESPPHGFLVAVGQLSVDGDVAVISKKEKKP